MPDTETPLEVEEKEEKEYDPAEPISVLRHHLHEVLLSLSDAGTLVGALDLVDSVRNSAYSRRGSSLARRLDRLEHMLEVYLGWKDAPLEELENTKDG